MKLVIDGMEFNGSAVTVANKILDTNFPVLSEGYTLAALLQNCIMIEHEYEPVKYFASEEETAKEDLLYIYEHRLDGEDCRPLTTLKVEE